MATPDFVVIGHAVRDIVRDGWRMGGTVTFAAAQAHQLGHSVGVVTSAGNDLDVQKQLPFATVIQVPSPAITTFENRYEHGGRTQRVTAQATAIARDDVPAVWRDAPLALVGPVLGEVDASMAAAFTARSLVGVSPQGWLRALDEDGNVARIAWDGEPFWRGADVIFVSDEDLVGDPTDVERWAADGAIIAMTASHRGARLFHDGRWRRIAAFPEEETDPTGAGDTFATAFLIRLHETGDPAAAARFGAAAASIFVGGIGVASTPTREQIEERMREHPGVTLQ